MIKSRIIIDEDSEVQSHHYRGPLASILGLMNLIKEENYNAPKKHLRMLKIIINSLDEKVHSMLWSL